MMHAPPPWKIQFSGEPGSHGDRNMYMVDKDGRKIAAVWGKRGEKEATGQLMTSAPDMRAALIAVEWDGLTESRNGGYVHACPFCGAEQSSGEHTDDCILWLALRKAGAR